MADNDKNKIYRTTEIYSGLNRPRLLMGGDRGLVIYSMIICVICVVILMTWYTVIFGVVFWFVALFILRQMADADPFMLPVMRKYLKYKKFYYPSSREDNK